MGLSCEQITSLLPVWDGANCGAAHERVSRLIEEKQTEIAERIAELEQFAASSTSSHRARADPRPRHAAPTSRAASQDRRRAGCDRAEAAALNAAPVSSNRAGR